MIKLLLLLLLLLMLLLLRPKMEEVTRSVMTSPPLDIDFCVDDQRVWS